MCRKQPGAALAICHIAPVYIDYIRAVGIELAANYGGYVVTDKELKSLILSLVLLLVLFSGAVWLGMVSKPLPTNSAATATAMALSATPTETATTAATATATTATLTATPPATTTAAETAYGWALPENKSFKAIEYACSLGWQGLPNGCVIVIDKLGKGFSHDGLNGPFGVVIPLNERGGVTIRPAIGWDRLVYISPEENRYTFVVIDEYMYIADQFNSIEPRWDEELLREFFRTGMGGSVETIWGLGLSDFN